MSTERKTYGPMICLRPREKNWPERLKAVAAKKGNDVTVTDLLSELIETNLPRLEAEVGLEPPSQAA